MGHNALRRPLSVRAFHQSGRLARVDVVARLSAIGPLDSGHLPVWFFCSARIISPFRLGRAMPLS